jgi:hypothetical protein
MQQARGDDALRRAAVFKWWKRFRNGEMSVRDESRSGRPSTAPVPLSSWSLRQTVYSTFSRSGWLVVRPASLAKGGTSKKRPSPHLHKVPTRSNKVSPRTFQTALVYYCLYVKYRLSDEAPQYFEWLFYFIRSSLHILVASEPISRMPIHNALYLYCCSLYRPMFSKTFLKPSHSSAIHH